MVFVGINLVPRAFFSNQSLCVRKEALQGFIQVLTDLRLPEVKTQS